MFREVAIASVALAGQMAYTAAVSIQKRDGGGGHSHGGGDVHDHSGGGGQSGGYSAPSSGYDEPAASYGGGAPSYGGGSSYGGGGSSYGGGGSGYGATGYGDDGGDLKDVLVPILLGLLTLAGLSLLFPTYVSLTSVGRKKREAEESAANPMNEIAERVNDIYYSVVESEECMQRIACEVGALAEDFGLKERSLASLAEPFVPSKYKSYYKQFTAGKNCQKIKCGKLSL